MCEETGLSPPLSGLKSSVEAHLLPNYILSKPASPNHSEMNTCPISPASSPDPNSPGAISSQPKPHAQARLLSSIDKCKVCEEPAAKHIHYGAVSCFSCRAFFRRSIQNNTALAYVCRRKKDCQINLKTRRNCQYCRYERCLAMGMQPSWVLSQEERNRRFKKNREKNIKSETEEMVLIEKLDEACSVRPATVIHTVCSVGAVRPGQQTENTNVQRIPQISPTNIQSKREIFVNHSISPVAESQWQAPHVTAVPIEQRSFKKEGDSNFTPLKMYENNFPVHLLPSTSSQGPSYSAISLSTCNGGVIVQPTLQTCPVSLVPESIPLNLAPQTTSMLLDSQHIPISLAPLQISVSPTSSRQSASMPISLVTRPNFDSFTTETISVSLTKDTRSTSFSPKQINMTFNPQTHSVHPIPCSSSQQNNYTPFHSQSGQVSFTNGYNQFKEATNYDDCEEMYNKEESDYEESIYSRSSDEEDRQYRRLIIEPEIKFSDEELSQLQMLVSEHDERYGSVNFGESLIKEMIMCSMFGIPVSTSAAISGYRLTVERMTRIAHNLSYFTDLPKVDQEFLMKENADLLVSLRGAIFFDSRKKGVNQLLISIGIEDMATIKSTIFAPLMKEESLKHIDYKTFNSIQQVNNNEVESRYNDLQSKVAEGIGDDISTILLTYIILFSVDFCPLSNRKRVEKIQEQYIRILQRYVYSQSDRHEACGKFAAALGSVTCIREMADIKKQRAMNQSVKMPT